MLYMIEEKRELETFMLKILKRYIIYLIEFYINILLLFNFFI